MSSDDVIPHTKKKDQSQLDMILETRDNTNNSQTGLHSGNDLTNIANKTAQNFQKIAETSAKKKVKVDGLRGN